MEPFEESQRQIRTAVIALLVILPCGIFGYMLLEQMSLLDAVWMTVITLTTIGYGDIVPQSPIGRIFTLFLIVIGIGVFVFAAQASLNILFSPELSRSRQRRRADRKVARMRQHFVICGEGEMVNRSVEFMIQRAKARLDNHRRTSLFRQVTPTLLDLLVVVTKNSRMANRLRRDGLIVIDGDPTDETTLRRSGVDRAQALMAMEDTDTETLLTVLTANSRNPELHITAAAHDLAFAQKMLRAGASSVIPPFEVAAQFLNSITFRPAVSEFFSSILFDNTVDSAHIVQVFMYDDSPWIGMTLGTLQLRDRYGAAAIGVRLEDGTFEYVPGDDYVLAEEVVLLVVCQTAYITALQNDSRQGTQFRPHPATWQRLVNTEAETNALNSFTAKDSEREAAALSKHYVICAGGMVARSALRKLSPERPFVVISQDHHLTESLLKRGFRVIQGKPTDESVMIRAGIYRALALMVAIDDRADSVLTTLTARTLNKHLLITASADNDDLVAKLYRAGADRVINPYRIAAQFMLLATTRPVVSDFIQYVLYNRLTRLETAELYIEDDSPWVGRAIGELGLTEGYAARIIGVRLSDLSFIYAPPMSFMISNGIVVLAVTSMDRFDALREYAYGSASRRPQSLRTTRPVPFAHRAGVIQSLS